MTAMPWPNRSVTYTRVPSGVTAAQRAPEYGVIAEIGTRATSWFLFGLGTRAPGVEPGTSAAESMTATPVPVGANTYSDGTVTNTLLLCLGSRTFQLPLPIRY